MNIEPNLQEELKKIEEKIQDAEENLGDVEVRDAIFEKASILRKMNKIEEAVEVFELALKRSVGISKKLEVRVAMLQLYLELLDLDKIKLTIDQSKKLLEEGGDWERKNKIKVRGQSQG